MKNHHQTCFKQINVQNTNLNKFMVLWTMLFVHNVTYSYKDNSENTRNGLIATWSLLWHNSKLQRKHVIWNLILAEWEFPKTRAPPQIYLNNRIQPWIWCKWYTDWIEYIFNTKYFTQMYSHQTVTQKSITNMLVDVQTMIILSFFLFQFPLNELILFHPSN